MVFAVTVYGCVFEWRAGMAEENHKPRNTIRSNGISARSRILDAIPSNVASTGFPPPIRSGRSTIRCHVRKIFRRRPLRDVRV